MKHTRISLLTWLLLAASVCATSAYAATVTKTIEFGQVEQYVEKSDYDAGQMADGTDRTLVIYSGGVNNTTKLTAADDDTYNTTVGATKLGNTGNKGSNLETLDSNSHKKYFIKFSALKDEKVRLYYFHASYPSGKDQSTFVNNTFNFSHKTNAFDAEIAGVAGSTLVLKKIYHVDFTIPEDGTYYISVYGGSTSVNVSGIRFSYNEAGTVIAETKVTGEQTFDASGWYADPLVGVVKTKATNSSGTDITATYQEKKGYCLNGTGNYVGVAVSGTTFKAGDVLTVFVTKVPSLGSLAVYGDIAGTDLVYDTQSYGVLGDNSITLPAAAEGKSVLYVARTASNTWNGRIYSVSVSRADIPYEMLFGYTWTAKTDPVTDASYDLVNYGVLRAGTAITAANGATGAMVRTSSNGVNMLSLNNKDNYIEVTASESLQAGDEISIMAYAGGDSERGLCIEPTSVSEYKASNTTTLKTTTYNVRELHHVYTATVTEEWLTANSIGNTIRIFRDNAGGLGIEKIEIIRHKVEITNVFIIGGSYNGTVLTEERIAALNEKKGATYPALEPSGADVRLTFAVTYMKDDDPEQTEVKNEEKVLTESGTDSKGNPKYTVTVGEQEYRITLQGYETIRTGLTEGKFGTMCLSGAVNSLLGATLYDIDWQNGSSIVLVEHTGAIEAGMPYIFEATESELKVCYKGSVEPVSTPGNHNGLYGTLEAMAAGSLADMYFVQNNEIRACSAAATLGANRAYIKLDEVPTTASPAPGRRRVLGAPQVATDVEEMMQDAIVHKMLKDGKVYIVREGKTYTVDGRTVE